MITPSGLSRSRMQQVLAQAGGDRSVTSRIEAFSGHFLGSPYTPFPLIGSANAPEAFVASLDGFDCVTYLETVLALACTTTVDGFIAMLRKIRYQDGRIEWKTRNHYMSGWIRNNQREGVVRRLSAASIPTVAKKRVLSIVPGLPARHATLKCIPKNDLPRLASYLRAGDLIFFVSTRENLDFFHAGILVGTWGKFLIRHASRSQGRVVEEKLGDFLKTNRMAGVVVVRPTRRADPARK